MEETHITLEILKLYLEEWERRHDAYDKYTISFFTISAVTSLIPYVEFKANVLSQSFPTEAFHIIGIVLSFISMCVSLSLSYRLSAVNSKYNSLLEMAGTEYVHKELPSKHMSWFYNLPLAKIIPIIMFVVLVVFNVYCLINS